MVRILVGLAAAALVSSSVAAQTRVASPVTTNAKTDDSQTIVCKRETDIGSLVAKRKVCKSKADWDREMLRARDSFAPRQSCRGGDAGTPC